MSSLPDPRAQPVRAVSGAQLTAPFFELGPKNLLRLPDIIVVAEAAQRAGLRNGVSVILTVPTALVAPVSAAVPGLYVFAQNLDADEPGPSVGRVTAESLLDAGARGVMLNHDSHPLDPSMLERTVKRAHVNDLMTMVCAGSEEQVLELAALHPTIVLFEPPSLIGGNGGGNRPWIRGIDERMRSVAPDVLMMHAGGVSAPEDAYQIMRSGAAGTGSTSGVLRAPSPVLAVGEFIRAVRIGFDDQAAE